MKIKTSKLTGPALDLAVHKAKGRNIELHMFWEYRTQNNMFHYSTDWAQGGPIIEREGIDLYCNVPSSIAIKNEGWEPSWRARYSRCGYGTEMMHGPTPLIAAMRCFVASKLGDEVEVPEELQ